MELACYPHHRSLTTPLLSHRNTLFSPKSSLLSRPPPLLIKPHLSSLSNSGFRDVRALASEEPPTFVPKKFETRPNDTTVAAKIEEKEEEEENPAPVSTPSADGDQSEGVGLLNNFNLKLDSDDTYSLLLYGSGALVAVWLSSAVVGAIDSIPVFPKVMEVVGLSFTVWFSYRYLIFKENREELFAKIEDLKQQVIGTDDD